jgi:hypothetical protein
MWSWRVAGFVTGQMVRCEGEGGGEGVGGKVGARDVR